MESKKSFAAKAIRRTIGNTKYLVVLNGMIRRYRDQLLYVKVDNEDLVFFTRTSAGGNFIEVATPAQVGNDVLDAITSSVLFGYNFTEWTHNYSEARQQYFMRFRVNPGLKILYIETDAYSMFRETVPSVGHAAIQYKPEVNGRMLNTGELSDLIQRFRLNGFMSLLDLMENKYQRNIRNHSRGIYKVSNSFFPAMIRTADTFNPFYDDMQVYQTVKDRKAFAMIENDLHTVRDINLNVAYISNTQAQESLNLSDRIPMSYGIFMRLLIGFLAEPDLLPPDFPHKTTTMYRLDTAEEGYDKFITQEQYAELNDYGRGFYRETTSYNIFFIKNRSFFVKNGYKDMTRLLEVMRHAVLV